MWRPNPWSISDQGAGVNASLHIDVGSQLENTGPKAPAGRQTINLPSLTTKYG